MEEQEPKPPKTPGHLRSIVSASSVKWFLAEFTVVVSGVLVALILNALYNQSQKEDRETAYLKQLKTELDESVAALESVNEYSKASSRCVERIIQQYWQVNPEQVDSLKIWMMAAHQYAPLALSTGTLNGLMTTGDIALISNDSLRTQIVNYHAHTASDLATVASFTTEWLRISAHGREVYDIWSLMAESYPEETLQAIIESVEAVVFPATNRKKQPVPDRRQ